MFRTPEDEVKALAEELRQLKELLRDISRKVVQIEGRAKRAFPLAFPKQPDREKPLGPRLTDSPTISPPEALKLYDDLVGMAKEQQKEEVQRRLENMALPNLFLLSRELGISLGKSKPSRRTLMSGVLGRINESIMLSMSWFRERPEAPRNDDSGAIGAATDPDKRVSRDGVTANDTPDKMDR